MKITLTNSFHGTEITTKVPKNLEPWADDPREFFELLSHAAQEAGPARVQRNNITRLLCGIKDCCCGVVRP